MFVGALICLLHPLPDIIAKQILGYGGNHLTKYYADKINKIPRLQLINYIPLYVRQLSNFSEYVSPSS